MKTLAAFVRAPPATRALALEAALFLLLARLLVARVPMRHWRQRLDTAAGSVPPPAGHGPRIVRRPRTIARIVRKVARRAPFRAVCLPQAMAAQWMLRRRGIASRLVFGVRRCPAADSGLQYHAWLTVDGEGLLGMRELETYAPLPPFGGAGITPTHPPAGRDADY